MVPSIAATPWNAAGTVKRRGIEIIGLDGDLIALRLAQATRMEAYPCRSDPRRTDHDLITGKVLPVDRDRVRSVFIVFCELGGIDPEASRWEEYDRYDEHETNWQHVQRLWDTALEDEADAPPFPRPTPPPPEPAPPRPNTRQEDPWASDARYSDEPPF